MFMKLLLSAALLWPVNACAAPEKVTVFAAASLRGALDNVATTFEADVVVSYGGSGTMARQVEAGAPADVIVLAAPVWMNWLRDRGLVDDAAQVDFLSNSLVLVAPNDSDISVDPADIAASLAGGRLVMGQRDAVPAGIYAQQWLKTSLQWDALLPALIETESVRAALALVARGEMPLGVVYRTDAMATPDVRVVYEVPQDQHSPIIYPAAALTEAGAEFLRHLQTPQSLGVFYEHGFLPVAP